MKERKKLSYTIFDQGKKIQEENMEDGGKSQVLNA